MNPLDIALCYESVLPAKGGAETYIGDLSRRLSRDGHTVHLYACRWDASALPSDMRYHPLQVKPGFRFQRPWRFARACEAALRQNSHDVSIGFDKTWGQDILYPQGGLHAASQFHNRLKFRNLWQRSLADLGKLVEPATWSFRQLERRQYLSECRSTVIVNSRMVQQHFAQFYGIPEASLRVIHSAIDPSRFQAENRESARRAERERWGISATDCVGLMVAMNYRLKGLEPLIRAAALVPRDQSFVLAIVGHPKFHRYEALARSLGVADRFRFLGFRADPREAYFAADFLVHPTFYDPCSLVVLEALACSLPVITTRYNGASELLDAPRAGLVVQNPQDGVELASALQRMLDSNYLTTAASAARQAAEQWTFEHHYQALLEVFSEVRARKRAT